jgi:hypothetical protein
VSNGPPTESDKYQPIVKRFDERASQLRRQANLFLWIIIAVLIAGTVAFIFANYIANLNLHPRTAETQYAAAVSGQEQTQEQEASVEKQINTIYDPSPITKSYDEKLRIVKDELWTFENSIVLKCKSITLRNRVNGSSYVLDLENAGDRIGETKLSTPDQVIYFSNSEDAGKCRKLLLPEHDKFETFLRQIQDIGRDRDDAITKFHESRQAELHPLNEKLNNLREEDQRRGALVSALQDRVTEEQVLGAPQTPEKGSISLNEPNPKVDWPQVIQNNVTRIGAILLTIFLVTILVPQYRYNLRMAGFYHARSDSLLLGARTEFNSPDELGRIVTMLTPNIDFGKAPPTPVEQVVEAIKALKN